MVRHLVDVSIRSALLAAGVAIVLRVARRRTTFAVQHGVWAIVLLGMLSLFAFGPVLPAIPLRILNPTVEPALKAFSLIPLETTGTRGPDSHKLPIASPSESGGGIDWTEIAACVYFIVAMFFAARLAIGVLLARRLLANSSEVGDFQECRLISIPMAVGWARPRILLPPDWRQWSQGTLSAVLMHERAHVRRRDGLVSLIAGINRCVLWFHPVAWFLEKKLALLAEQACDEMTVAGIGDPVLYARLLIRMAGSAGGSAGRLRGFALPMAAPSHLRRRIDALLEEGKTFRTAQSRPRWLMISICGSLAVLTAGGVQIDSRSEPTPKFDVAAIRLCRDLGGRMWGTGAEYVPGRMNTGCLPLAAPDNTGLIQRAYVRFASGHLHSFGVLPIKGGPAWIHSDLYQIEATAEGRPRPEMMQGPMLQALLEERFRLRIRRNVQQGPVYALTLARGARD